MKLEAFQVLALMNEAGWRVGQPVPDIETLCLIARDDTDDLPERYEIAALIPDAIVMAKAGIRPIDVLMKRAVAAGGKVLIIK